MRLDLRHIYKRSCDEKFAYVVNVWLGKVRAGTSPEREFDFVIGDFAGLWLF